MINLVASGACLLVQVVLVPLLVAKGFMTEMEKDQPVEVLRKLRFGNVKRLIACV